MEKYGNGTVWNWEAFVKEQTPPPVVEPSLEVTQHAADEPALDDQPDAAPKFPDRVDLSSVLRTETAGHVPPEAVARTAEQGLALREKLKRGGVTVPVARARELKDRKPLSDNSIKHMARFFERWPPAHPGAGDMPSPEYVAWLLWGGAPGREWAEREMAAMAEGGKA